MAQHPHALAHGVPQNQRQGDEGQRKATAFGERQGRTAQRDPERGEFIPLAAAEPAEQCPGEQQGKYAVHAQVGVKFAVKGQWQKEQRPHACAGQPEPPKVETAQIGHQQAELKQVQGAVEIPFGEIGGEPYKQVFQQGGGRRILREMHPVGLGDAQGVQMRHHFYGDGPMAELVVAHHQAAPLHPGNVGYPNQGQKHGRGEPLPQKQRAAVYAARQAVAGAHGAAQGNRGQARLQQPEQAEQIQKQNAAAQGRGKAILHALIKQQGQRPGDAEKYCDPNQIDQGKTSPCGFEFENKTKIRPRILQKCNNTTLL